MTCAEFHFEWALVHICQGDLDGFPKYLLSLHQQEGDDRVSVVGSFLIVRKPIGTREQNR